jgi:hypothetical protein
MATVNHLRGDYGEDKNWELHKSEIRTLNDLLDALNNTVDEAAGLVIKAGGSTLAKNGNKVRATVEGSKVSIAADTDMPALSGTITAEAHNVFGLFVDSSGTVTSVMGTEGSTLATVVLPDRPADNAMIGMIKVSPSQADFVGGTTLLDAADTNVEYIDTPGPQLLGKQRDTLTTEA